MADVRRRPTRLAPAAMISAAIVRTIFCVSRIFRLAIDEDTLTDELFAFVVDPRSTRYQRRVVTELKVIAPGMIPVMEMMIMDGVDERRYVREYVSAVLGDGADRDVYYAT